MGANVNIADEQDNAALRWAARGGHLDAARILLDSGADVNQKSRSGWTALLEAIIAGSLPLVKLLIERGADINARIQNGGSIRYFARDILIYAADKQVATQIYDHIVSLGAEYHSPDVDQD